MQPRAFSLRDVPAVIYVSIALNVVTTFAVVLVMAAKGIHEWDIEAFHSMEIWRTVEQTSSDAAAVLLPLGLLSLARRQTGSGRSLTVTGAALLFSSFMYLALQLIVMFVQPVSDLRSVYEYLGYAMGFVTIASTVLLTIGTQAWRRVTLAAAGMCVLIVTSYWVPLIGKQITEGLGHDPIVRQAYAFVREALWATCYLFIAAALAAQTYRAPDVARAASGLRIARVVLLVRVYLAVALVLLLLIGFKTPDAGIVVAVGTPLIAFVTMLIFAIALVRVATSDVDGMPRLRVAIGAGAVMWWVFTQLYACAQLYSTLKRHSDEVDTIGPIAYAAPVAGAIGLGLVGSGIAAIAAHRGDQSTAGSLTGRTIAVVMLSLASIGLQTLTVKATSVGMLVMLSLGAVGCALASLIVLVGILGIATRLVEAAPVPAARVV